MGAVTKVAIYSYYSIVSPHTTYFYFFYLAIVSMGVKEKLEEIIVAALNAIRNDPINNLKVRSIVTPSHIVKK